MTSKQMARIGYVTIGAAFIIRLIYGLYFQPISHSLYSDMQNYVSVSTDLLNNKWLPTHFFQPIGFPTIIFFLRSFFIEWTMALGIFHAIISTLSLWFIWKSATKSFGEKLGLISLIFASVHIHWITLTAVALSETTFTFLLSVLLWLTLKVVQKKSLLNATAWAITFLLSYLMKGTHLFYGPLFLIGLFLLYQRSSLKMIGIISLIVGSGLITHGLFTFSKIGKFQLSASAGGLNFVEGKCPNKNNSDSNGYSWLSPLYNQMNMNTLKKWDQPFTNSDFFMQEGFKCIAENPLTLIQSFEAIPFLFFGNTMWPANQFKQAGFIRLYELYFSIFALTGLVLYFRSSFPWTQEKISEFLIWGLPILSLFLCVYIFKSEIRFRVPFDVWLIPVGVKGWSELVKSKAT